LKLANLLGMVLLLMVVTVWDLNDLSPGSANNTLSERVVCTQDSWEDASLSFCFPNLPVSMCWPASRQYAPLGFDERILDLFDFFPTPIDDSNIPVIPLNSLSF
jgi:hypothetical protein